MELNPRLDEPPYHTETTYRRQVHTANSPRGMNELMAEKMRPRQTGLDGFRDFAVDPEIEKTLRKNFGHKVLDSHAQ
jgi:hypothetical protein